MVITKVIITGASGFVGANLVEYLLTKKIDVQKMSLRQDWGSNVLNGSDVVLHLAGKAHDTENTDEASEYFKVNRDLTIKLFDQFLVSESKDFVYFSSVKAVADIVPEILTENTIENPMTPYGKSKLEAEKYILSKKIPEGKRIFIIRPCMIHGPGNKGNLNLLYQVVKKGIPYPLAAFENERSFLSIENLNFLIYKIIENKSIKSGIYNFADDGFISTNKLISIISEGINKKTKRLRIPKAIIVNAARIGDVLSLPLNSERLNKLTENYRVDNQKIKKELNLDKLPISAEEGLLHTIKSFDK